LEGVAATPGRADATVDGGAANNGEDAARLEKNGFIGRQRSDSDRRVFLVSLTDSGRALEHPVTLIWDALEKLTTNALTPAEKDQLRFLPGKLVGSLTKRAEEESNRLSGVSAG
jgi:hypothetical protein